PSTGFNLPLEYRKNGIRIGDVGIINSSGLFDFLFNVCLAADHPINSNRVPEGFKPLPLPDHQNIFNGRVTEGFGIYRLGVPSDYNFKCTGHEGAILILPEGSYREDLHAIGIFRGYASRNGESWYHYANSVRCREAVNGSLHLVTGCHKSTAWALGAFAHSSSS
ncbi:hypothetical protein BDQ17DRAFT_1209609, partial [Cyathus striatus]